MPRKAPCPPKNLVMERPTAGSPGLLNVVEADASGVAVAVAVVAGVSVAVVEADVAVVEADVAVVAVAVAGVAVALAAMFFAWRLPLTCCRRLCALRMLRRQMVQ